MAGKDFFENTLENAAHCVILYLGDFMKLRRLLSLAILLLLLSACAMQEGEELLRPPQPPVEHNGLIEDLKKHMTGAAYAPPLAGENRQTIQMIDLDGDGVSEALVCLRFTAEPVLRIFVYKLVDDEYRQVAVMPGAGDSINSITYTDLNQDGLSEVVVTYMMGSVKAMSVYTYFDDTMTAIYEGECTSFTIADINNDGIKSLMVVTMDSTARTGNLHLMGYEEGQLVRIATAPLSKGVTALNRMSVGALRDNVPALFVTSALVREEGASSEIVTDIFIYQEDSFVNILADPETGISKETARALTLYSANIDNDPSGITEVPKPVAFPVYDQEDPLYCVNWMSFDSAGRPLRALSTYHTRQGGWYLVLPEEWVDKITVRVEEITPKERRTIFSLYHGERTRPTPLLTMHTYTVSRAMGETVTIGDRILMHDGATLVVLAEMHEDAGVTEEQLRKSFHLIQSEWLSGVLP